MSGFLHVPNGPFPFIDTETGVVTGDTGAYSGATGTFTGKVKGALLTLDATGVRRFGWFKATERDDRYCPVGRGFRLSDPIRSIMLPQFVSKQGGPTFTPKPAFASAQQT